MEIIFKAFFYIGYAILMYTLLSKPNGLESSICITVFLCVVMVLLK